MSSLLGITGVDFSYGSLPVLRDISIQIQPRDLILLTGPNGSGKTTLLRLLAGFLKPQQAPRGFRLPPTRFFSPRGGLYEDLTLQQNLDLFAGLGSVPPEHLQELAGAMGLGPCLNRRVAELSYGQRVRGSLCRTFLADVPLYLLDEPFTGLDTEAQETLFKMIERQKKRGAGFVIATHETARLKLLSTRELTLGGGHLRERSGESS